MPPKSSTSKTTSEETIAREPRRLKAKLGQRVLFRRHPSAPDVSVGIVTACNNETCDVLVFHTHGLAPKSGVRHIGNDRWKDPGYISDEDSGSWEESDYDRC